MTELAFENLRIADIKALKECRLLRLGRINVICGRNNSGKSTLLEGIVDAKKRFPGLTIDLEYAPLFFKALYASGGWSKSHPAEQTAEGRTLLKIIDSCLQDPRLMFLNESPLLAKAITERVQNSSLRQWTFHTNGINALFAAWMPSQQPSVLVSPKRQLDTRKGVSAGEGINASGSGILNFLFFAKNQPKTSSEWRTYSRIASAFTDISNGYAFDVFISRANELELRFAQEGRNWVDAADCGLGLQDLLVLLYFSIIPEYSVVAIEEPESHLHPEMQRRLLGFLKQCEDRQFFLSTHSNVFLNNAYVDRVFFTTFTDVVNVADATSRASMLDDLGYSVADNLVSDVVVLVEGPTDTPVIEELLLKKGVLPTFDVKIWPLGGDIMDQLDLSLLTQAYNVVALLDRDPGSSKVRKRFRSRCDEAGIPVVQLKRYAIENYFTLNALRTVFGSQIPASVEVLATNATLESQIGINVKRNNRRLARELSMSDLEGTDLDGFLDIVRSLCEESASKRTES